MSKSKISWTMSTWNPTTGCSKISAGCCNCYASEMSRRLNAMGQTKYQYGFIPTIHSEELNKPYTWKKPRTVFVNSMSDLFHSDFLNTGFIQQVFNVMNECPQHTFQILSKRANNLERIAPELNWTKNIWIGVSIENNSLLHRVDSLRNVPTPNRFLSIEPLLGPLPELDLNGIEWVIIGGEKGRSARPMNVEWVYPIKDQCDSLGIPFFFKQMGGRRKVDNLLTLDNVEYHGLPEGIRL